MNRADHRWQQAVLRKSPEGARHGEGHAADIAQHRDRCAHQQQQPSRAPDELLGCKRERRGFHRGEAATQHPLSDEMHGEIEQRHAGHRDRQRTRHGARWIPHFATRHQCGLATAEGEHEDDRGAREARRCGHLRDNEVGGLNEEHTDADEEQQRKQLGYAQHHDQSRALLHAADVDQCQRDERDRDDRRADRRQPDERAESLGEGRRHAGDGRGSEHPEQHAGKESDVATEYRLDVRVGAAGERDAAASFSEAEHHAPHHGGADQVDERRSGAGRRRGARRKPEDSPTDGHVENAGRESEDPDRAHQSRRR